MDCMPCVHVQFYPDLETNLLKSLNIPLSQIIVLRRVASNLKWIEPAFELKNDFSRRVCVVERIHCHRGLAQNGQIPVQND